MFEICKCRSTFEVLHHQYAECKLSVCLEKLEDLLQCFISRLLVLGDGKIRARDKAMIYMRIVFCLRGGETGFNRDKVGAALAIVIRITLLNQLSWYRGSFAVKFLHWLAVVTVVSGHYRIHPE